MEMTILLFASLQEKTGTARLAIAGEELGSVSEVYDRLVAKYPELAGQRDRVLVAVNGRYASWQDRVEENDEVAFFPPVSGG